MTWEIRGLSLRPKQDVLIRFVKGSSSHSKVKRCRGVDQCINGHYGRIQMRGYAARDPMEPIAYKQDLNKAPHFPRSWAKLYAEQVKFSITFGDGDWLHDRDH